VIHRNTPLSETDRLSARSAAYIDRLPDVHLDPNASYPTINGLVFRSPAALPVEFTAA
jgi:hypothetical protein